MTRRLQNSIKSPFGLLLFVFCFCTMVLQAQPHFNRFYTNNAHASTMDAVVAHGADGGFMAVATAIDSAKNYQGLRIGRYDADGKELVSHFFSLPDSNRRIIHAAYKGLVQIHNNCYAASGIIDDGINYKIYSFLLLSDSNGKVYRYTEITDRDSSNDISNIQYDGMGHIIVAGHFVTAAADSSYTVIAKFDTLLNRQWLKSYTPSGIFLGGKYRSLLVDSSGYVLCGGTQNTGLNDFKGYKVAALLFKTDTAGAVQWLWQTATSSYSQYEHFISSAIRTMDGGYAYVVSGHTYNSLPVSYPGISLEAKTIVVKLDAARNRLWDIEIDDYFLPIGLNRTDLLELPDSSILYLGAKTTDSTAPNYKDGYIALERISTNGKRLYSRHLVEPKEPGDTHKESGGGFFHLIRTADKRLLMAGTYINATAGATAPTQRGWLMKLDSNGCLGAGDPQCWPLDLKEAKVENTIKIYPNPSNDFFEIDNTNSLKAILKITDIVGKLVYQEVLPKGISQIDARQWAADLYLYTIYEGNKIIGNGKLLKQ